MPRTAAHLALRIWRLISAAAFAVIIGYVAWFALQVGISAINHGSCGSLSIRGDPSLLTWVRFWLHTLAFLLMGAGLALASAGLLIIALVRVPHTRAAHVAIAGLLITALTIVVFGVLTVAGHLMTAVLG